MAGTTPGKAVLALAALAAGFGGGWMAGRAALPPPPPPDVFVNPLSDAKKGESIVLLTPDGAREQVRVEEVTEDSLLLSFRSVVRGSPDHVREIRVAKTYTGFFYQIEGDLPPADAAAAVRNFVVESMEPTDLRLEALDRTVRCWRIRGTYRGGEPRVYWISADFPVHGLLRADGARGKVWEIESFEEAR
jgi:hypothetical protein